jgi:hypothetical protein
LSVASELLATGETPALPSAIEVVDKPNGLFDVLVSSQGSDTISVFDVGGALPEPGTPSAGGPSTASLGSTAVATQVVVLTSNAIAASAPQTAASTSTSASTSSGSLSTAVTSTVGLSLGSFSSLGNGPAQGADDAILVRVEGSSYISVPILGFGSEDEDADNGEGRMPWLSTLHPFGDTSPLTRFVTGLDEVLRAYRGSEDAPALRSPGPSNDPWNEDLFYRHLPVQPPDFGQENDAPMGVGSPKAMLPGPLGKALQDDRVAHARFGDEGCDDPGVLASSPMARILAECKILAGLLAAVPLTLAISGYDRRETEQPGDLVAAQATPDGH